MQIAKKLIINKLNIGAASTVFAIYRRSNNSFAYTKRYSVVDVIGWSILYHVVSALTMTKKVKIFSEIENDAFLFSTYIKEYIGNTIVK